MKLLRTTPTGATCLSVVLTRQFRFPERSAPFVNGHPGLCVVEDLEDAHLTHAARTFSTTEARERDLRNVDVAYGTQQDAAVLVLGPGERLALLDEAIRRKSRIKLGWKRRLRPTSAH